jgi:tetratricopeptide (TPR) repeat protein
MQEVFNQANALHQQGKLQQAEQIYRKILEQAPGQPVVCARLSFLLQQTGRLPEAFGLIDTAIQGLSKEFEVLMQGANLAVQLGENLKAEEWLVRAYELKPKNEKVLEQLAGVLIGNHKEKKALEMSKALIKLSPKSANAYNLKGLALSRLGDTDKGYASFQKSIKLNPSQIAVIRNLILYGKGRKEPLLDQIIPQLEKTFNSQTQPPVVQMNVAYILSMYYERDKNTDKTFTYLKMGNDIAKQSAPYHHSQTQAQFSQMTDVFSKQFVEAMSGHQLDDESPIFILGMPRSGTTLIEQILSSHSQVKAEGEITDLRDSFTKHHRLLDDDLPIEDKIVECQALMSDYVASVRQRRSSVYFTDKMPYNFIFVGAILSAMPKAKVIHCTRDPIETCFSIYKQNFAGSHAYTNDLVDLGQYYKSYQNLMSHWKSVFGDKIYEANYESIVDDSENQISSLLAYCGLEKEDACFEFHKNKRAVRTASVAQVRQPIYKDAKKASSPYEKHLQPLIEELAAK